jgi:hypothetical protein
LCHFVASVKGTPPAKLVDYPQRPLLSPEHQWILLDVHPTRAMNAMTARIHLPRQQNEIKAFTLGAENNIVVHASAKPAPKTEGTELFTSEKALTELAAAWPAGRLGEIFNSLIGVTPVEKFADQESRGPNLDGTPEARRPRSATGPKRRDRESSCDQQGQPGEEAGHRAPCG